MEDNRRGDFQMEGDGKAPTKNGQKNGTNPAPARGKTDSAPAGGEAKKKLMYKRVMPKRKKGGVGSRTMKGGTSKKGPNEDAAAPPPDTGRSILQPRSRTSGNRQARSGSRAKR